MEYTKRIVIVGEMHNDIFYKIAFFKTLEDQVTEKIYQYILDLGAKIRTMKKDDVQKIIHDVISGLPKKNAGEAVIKRGGNGNNSTELFATLGLPIKLMTVIGQNSEWMKDELEAMSVDTSCVFQLPKMTPISAIIEDPVTTKIFTGANLKKEMNFSSISVDASHFADASIVFFTPMAPKFEPILSSLASMATGILTAITLESQAIDSIDLLRDLVKTKVDVLFANDADALAITGGSTIDEADAILLDFARIRVFTLGGAGSTIRSDLCDSVDIPVFQVKVIDRTGAGDAFAAGVLVKCHEFIEKSGNLIEYLETLPEEDKKAVFQEIGTFGAASAALKISLARTPSMTEVADFLNNQ
ncbi:MAG TPA: carbohydrate kinase family protein [Candidatus Lokiarchaeia archaeon]|nr:carbohydrate kinase family protein [Candidatus Lokiarchaeia archaeon]